MSSHHPTVSPVEAGDMSWLHNAIDAQPEVSLEDAWDAVPDAASGVNMNTVPGSNASQTHSSAQTNLKTNPDNALGIQLNGTPNLSGVHKDATSNGLHNISAAPLLDVLDFDPDNFDGLDDFDLDWDNNLDDAVFDNKQSSLDLGQSVFAANQATAQSEVEPASTNAVEKIAYLGAPSTSQEGQDGASSPEYAPLPAGAPKANVESSQALQGNAKMPTVPTCSHINHYSQPTYGPTPNAIWHPAVLWYEPVAPSFPSCEFWHRAIGFFKPVEFHSRFSRFSGPSVMGGPQAQLPSTNHTQVHDYKSLTEHLHSQNQHKGTKRPRDEDLASKFAPASGQTIDFPAGYPHPLKGMKTSDIIAVTHQKCSCKNVRKVARSSNVFMLFRSQYFRDHPGIEQTKVSAAASAAWKQAEKHIKKHFKRQADQQEKQLKQNHPDYKYVANSQKMINFGFDWCTCGAWDVNMAALEAFRKTRADEGAQTPVSNAYDADYMYSADTALERPVKRLRGP